MATTLNAATFVGKNFSTMQNVVKNQESLVLKQIFDVTAQIIHNEEEITGLDKILYQKNSWTQLSLINDPVVINLQSTKVYVFSDFCVVSRQSSSTSRIQRSLEKQCCKESEPREATEIMMMSVERRQNSSGISSQDSQRCSSVTRSAIFSP